MFLCKYQPLGNLLRSNKSTVDANTIAKMDINKYLLTVSNGQRRSSATGSAVILLLEGGNRWLG